MEAYKAYFIFVGVLFVGEVDSYFATLRHNGPVVLGANITFIGELFSSYGDPPSGTFRFRWEDNAIHQNQAEFEGRDTVSTWNVSYPADQNPPGKYEVQVTIAKSAIFFWPLTSQRANFNLTSLLNGQLVLTQGNTTLINGFVSNAKQVTHNVRLHKPDLEFLAANATSVRTYWFVDCKYYGQSSDYQFLMNYTEAGKIHNIEALIIASYEPIVTTTVAPETTTTPTTTTSLAPPTNITTTTSTTTTTIKPTTTEKPNNDTYTDIPSFIASNDSVNLPFVCLNSSLIPPDPKKTYGYFHQRMQVKAPISNIKVDGTNWLQRDDLLNLLVSWNGSSNYEYCLSYIPGPYNVTGKEECRSGNVNTRNNSFKIMHYFRTQGIHTILIFISNDVSSRVSPVTITIYEVTKQAQLSVIVVPVTCSFLAVILIVFGVAYYIQSRSRYTVEVADFNFVQTDNMEYKTFRERLKEAVQGNGYHCPDFGKPGENNWASMGTSSSYGRMGD